VTRAPRLPRPRAPALDPPDALRTATAVGLLAGALALRWAYFDALAAALAACAAAAALVRASSLGPRATRSATATSRWGPWVVPPAVAGGWAFFFLSPAELGYLRGLALALGALGLWLWLRGAIRPGEVGE
jgi:hypothetical protein